MDDSIDPPPVEDADLDRQDARFLNLLPTVCAQLQDLGTGDTPVQHAVLDARDKALIAIFNRLGRIVSRDIFG